MGQWNTENVSNELSCKGQTINFTNAKRSTNCTFFSLHNYYLNLSIIILNLSMQGVDKGPVTTIKRLWSWHFEHWPKIIISFVIIFLVVIWLLFTRLRPKACPTRNPAKRPARHPRPQIKHPSHWTVSSMEKTIEERPLLPRIGRGGRGTTRKHTNATTPNAEPSQSHKAMRRRTPHNYAKEPLTARTAGKRPGQAPDGLINTHAANASGTPPNKP